MTFPIYVGLSSIIGVIFVTVIKYLLSMKRILVKCLVLQEERATKWCNVY